MIALANFNCLTIGVWLVGLIVAFGRRSEHPQVSAAVLASIACMFVAGSLSTYLGLGIWSPSLPGPGTLALVGLANFVLFSIGWGAILAAAVGWREQPVALEQPRAGFQFSIRGLFMLTVLVAILCGILRLLVWVLEIEPIHLPLLLGDVPFFAFWIVGAWLAWDRHHKFPEASDALAWGIGIQAGPISTLAVFAVAARVNPGPIDNPFATSITLFAMFAFFLAFPLSWIFLLAAALGWRDQRPRRGERAPAPASADRDGQE